MPSYHRHTVTADLGFRCDTCGGAIQGARGHEWHADKANPAAACTVTCATCVNKARRAEYDRRMAAIDYANERDGGPGWRPHTWGRGR